MARVTRKGRNKIKGYIKNEVASEVQRKWRANLTEDQESLREDIRIFEEENLIQVGTRNEVLKFLEFGTRPHKIEADEAQALRWFNDEGDPVFAVSVMHPGIDAYGHLRSAIDEVTLRSQNQ